MSKCYYSSSTKFSHDHLGPDFLKCGGCKRVICHDCLGHNLSPTVVLCFECTSLAAASLSNKVNLNQKYPRDTVPSQAIILVDEIFDFIINITTRFFSGVANLLLVILIAIGTPFRDNRNSPVSKPMRIDLSFTHYRDKMRFTVLFIVIVVVATIFAILYADARYIPRARVLLALAATGVSWGITATYLLYLFDGPLGRPVSQILAYVVSLFIALIFGFWVIEQRWLDMILGFFS